MNMAPTYAKPVLILRYVLLTVNPVVPGPTRRGGPLPASLQLLSLLTMTTFISSLVHRIEESPCRVGVRGLPAAEA